MYYMSQTDKHKVKKLKLENKEIIMIYGEIFLTIFQGSTTLTGSL
jgi:hypothetical protein